MCSGTSEKGQLWGYTLTDMCTVEPPKKDTVLRTTVGYTLTMACVNQLETKLVEGNLKTKGHDHSLLVR